MLALQAGNWPLTLALYEQQAALLRSAGMKYKLLTHLYTYSTLLYVRCLGLPPSSLLAVSSHQAQKYYEVVACHSVPAASALLAQYKAPACCHEQECSGGGGAPGAGGRGAGPPAAAVKGRRGRAAHAAVRLCCTNAGSTLQFQAPRLANGA
jgi:hypothetical protein